jgi:predicted LPLAT superfamily acyltransferase
MNGPASSRPEWMTRRERSAVAPIKFFAFLALRLGRPVARLLLYPICLYYVLFAGAPGNASRQYLAKVFNRRPGFGDVFRHFHAFAACVLDRIYLLNNQTGIFDIHVEGEDFTSEVLSHGAGCLLVGAHLGSFEVLRSLGARRPDLRVVLVMYEENARKITAVLNAINERHDIEIISLGRPDSMLKVQATLDAGGMVGMLADRSLGGEAELRCDFLGQSAAFPLGPLQIAAMLHCPVVLMFALYRGGNRYDVHFEKLTDWAAVVQGQRAAAVKEVLRAYVKRLEHYCRLAPYNWFNFYDFWK